MTLQTAKRRKNCFVLRLLRSPPFVLASSPYERLLAHFRSPVCRDDFVRQLREKQRWGKGGRIDSSVILFPDANTFILNAPSRCFRPSYVSFRRDLLPELNDPLGVCREQHRPLDSVPRCSFFFPLVARRWLPRVPR